MHETSELFQFLPLYNIWKDKRVGFLRMAFRARKVFGTFEQRAKGPFAQANKICKWWRYLPRNSADGFDDSELLVLGDRPIIDDGFAFEST